MKVEEQYVEPASKLMSDYINGKSEIRQYFSYDPKLQSFDERVKKLQSHSVDRPKLAGIIRDYMARHGLSDAAKENLASFEKGAPVVVTGQQAGLLTGPLYTVHKAISVIILAKQASAQLQTKVVPVFWIAGEDHDLAEISHLYREVNGRVDKLNIPHAEYGKHSASSAKLNTSKIASFLEEYFRSLPETEHSKEIHDLAFNLLEHSISFTDFFASLLHYFFQEEGLLYIDAADREFRNYESPYFKQMIEHAAEIAETVSATERLLVEDGYSAVIGAEENAANLFITVKGERLLLERRDDEFLASNGAIRYTKQQLLDIAQKNPELLSNNVVTRPLMQEMVFPVLAFVGGPGEIAYWAALKGAFELFDMELPVIMPRLSLTLVNRQTQRLLNKYELDVSAVLNDHKITEIRNELTESIREQEAEAVIEELQNQMEAAYVKIDQQFSSISKGLTPIVEKNLQLHIKQLKFLKNKLQDEVMLQNSIEFGHYDSIENELLPNGGFQERIYSPFVYMNQYGTELVKDLLALPLHYDKNHKIIYF
ncbi:bacillithiol biosynthesis cysteine-adding enzyme BshC [Planococcus sp. CPCC 101016]|uniref:bacillithiol biosynthesis cysteine-adding enzyme BshC n=1 Tax=Planococcus sp. CPCC 101016 TaxID=2599617 RepID=UPI0011B49953|nr:bacillithiol biosynthesis cysteine-adding enzyme BshC [Planococcus sp. CPCC 101016]TWT07431.1 bacillithiol biosynthesis cysteine-adding enzyme BshC [Planococcus sp. CPCC 101016]